MPTYEYECSVCKYKFEILQGIKEEPKSKCPKCGKKLKKLISSSGGFIFKGSGFYATDYKKTSKPSKSSVASTCPKAMALAKGGQTMALRPKEGCAGCPNL